MKTLAFLQNTWVRNPDQVRAFIARNGENYRRRFLSYALFAGCLTGRRLKAAFGYLCDEIVWENVTKEVTGSASQKVKADLRHVTDRISEEKPDVILCFGTTAFAAVGKSTAKIQIIHAPHPAARHALVLFELDRAAKNLRELIQLQRISA